MFVSCEKCGRSYDDARRWTICPHNRLEAGHATPYYNCGNGGYCEGHDLFACTMTPIVPTADDVRQAVLAHGQADFIEVSGRDNIEMYLALLSEPAD